MSPSRWGHGNTRADQEFRAKLLREHPICMCRGCPNCKPSHPRIKSPLKGACGQPSTDDDHIRCKAEGGGDEPSNRQALCHPCHGWKTKQEALRGNQRKPTSKRPKTQHPSGIEL